MATMSKAVTLCGRSADAVVAAATTHRGVVKDALTTTLGAAAGDAAATLLDAGAAALATEKKKLFAAEAAHAIELSDDLAVRVERDDAALAVRAELMQLRPTLEATAGSAYGVAVGLTGPTPDDPMVLHRLAMVVAAGLRREPLPPSKLPGYTLPAGTLADTLSNAARRLEQALAAMARETKENQETLQKRDDALAGYTTVFRAVANLTSVLLAAGGQDVLASKVRPSARRPGQTEEVANSKETETPVG